MPEAPLNAAEFSEFRRRLEERRSQLEESAGRLDAEGLDTALGDSLGELSTYDNHPGDIGEEVFERGKDLALKESLRRQVAQVDHALARLESGEYGRCERCRRPIGRARLAAMPEATLCVSCRRKVEAAEGQRQRPVEEEVLHGSLRGLYPDDPDRAPADENLAYDREDAWQDVEQYGTSSDEGRGG